MPRLKIALVSDFYPPRVGGIERQIEGLAGALAALGHETHVYTTVRGDSPLPHPRVVVHRLPYARIEWAGIALPNFAKLPAFRNLLRREDFDVVHAHAMFSSLAIGSLLAASTLRIPSLTTLHSLLSPAVLQAARTVFAIWSRRAGRVTAVSRAAAIDAGRASGRSDVLVLPNGIDHRAWRGPDNEPVEGQLVSVMRLTRKKAPIELVRALPHVLAAVAAPSPLRLTIVGDGPERPRLEREARVLGVSDRIDFLGMVPPEDVQATLARARIFVLPSPNEAFGLAALEARCAGLPVVAMNGGGMSDLMEHGRQGLLARDRTEFADAITRLVTDDALRLTMRKAAPAGLERFGWDAVADRHVQAYRETIANAKGVRRPGSSA